MSRSQNDSSESASTRTLDKLPSEEAISDLPVISTTDPRPRKGKTENRRSVKSRLWIVLPVLTSAALALLGSAFIFPFLSENHDEPVYLLQAEALRSGSLTVQAPDADAGAFRPWLTELRDGEYIFKYTPVHAAFLVVGRNIFGSYRASLALIAAGLAAAVLLLALELLPTRRAALTATWAFLLSPLVLVVNATYLSYSSSLMLHATFAVLLFRGITHDRPILLALSGLALGFGFFARPLDAIVFSLPLLLFFLVRTSKSNRGRKLGWFAAGASGPLALAGAHNIALMGNPFSFPFSILDGSDTLGFGSRRMVPGHRAFDYSVVDALAALGQQALWLQIFTFGGPLLSGLFAWYLFRRKTKDAHRALAWIVLTVPVAYFFFWGSYHITIALGWGRIFGPMYWLPMLVPLTLIGAAAWFELLSRNPHRAKLLAGAMVSVTAVGIALAALANYEVASRDRDVYRMVASGEQGRDESLILLPSYQGAWVLHPFAAFRNDLQLQNKTIYAVSRGSKNVELALNHPERDLYQLRLIGAPGSPRDVTLLPSKVSSEPVHRIDLHIENTFGRRYVAVQVIRDTSLQWATIDTESVKGRAYDINLTLSAGGAGGLDWEPGGFRKKEYPLAIAVYFSHTPDFQSRRAVEQRFWHRVDQEGDLQLLTPGETFKGLGNSRKIAWELVEKHPALKLEIAPASR